MTPPSQIEQGASGGYEASFEFTNETETDLDGLRVGVVCYDEAGSIIGGDATYPSLAPADQTIRIDAHPTVEEHPDFCEAFLNYGS